MYILAYRSNKMMKISSCKQPHDAIVFMNWMGSKENGIEVNHLNPETWFETYLTELRNILVNQGFARLCHPWVELLMISSDSSSTNLSKEEIIKLTFHRLKEGLSVVLTHGHPFCFLEEIVPGDTLEHLSKIMLPRFKMAEKKSIELYSKIESHYEKSINDLIRLDFSNQERAFESVRATISPKIYEIFLEYYAVQMELVFDVISFCASKTDLSVPKVCMELFEKMNCKLYNAIYLKDAQEQMFIEDIMNVYKVSMGMNYGTNFPDDLSFYMNKAA